MRAELGELTERETTLLDTVERAFTEVGDLIARHRQKQAVGEAMRAVGEVNRYVSDTEPWKLKGDDERARLGTVLNTWTTDTGTLAAEAQEAAQGNVILTLGVPVTAQFLRLDIADAPAFTDIGLCIAGALWRVQRGMAYGMREGRVILDRRDRNPFTGAEFPVPAIANPRVAAFTLPSLSTSEARNQHRDLVRLLGAARDGLVIMELNDTLAERNRRAIWGAINMPGEDAAVTRDSFPLSSRAFRVVERL